MKSITTRGAAAHTIFSLHTFDSKETLPFRAEMYSRLKFGSDITARTMGYQLADGFFTAHRDVLLTERCVVIPSPYNYVPNAATCLARHFIRRLNERIAEQGGRHVEYTLIHRKVSYTGDFGTLSTKQARKTLLDGDTFFLNRDYLKDCTILVIDDVRITGTHEDKIVEVLRRDDIRNNALFLYYGQYFGNEANIEDFLNFAAVQSVEDFVEISREPDHNMIVRPIKYLMSLPSDTFARVAVKFSPKKMDELYFGCLGEGYHNIEKYKKNFSIIQSMRHS